MNPVSWLPGLAALNPGDLPSQLNLEDSPGGVGWRPTSRRGVRGRETTPAQRTGVEERPYPPGVGVGGYYNLGRSVNIEGHRGGLRHGRFHFEDRPGAKE